MRPAAAGLYVPSREFAHAGHELTQKILESKISREHDPLFAQLLARSTARHFPNFKPDLVVSLPPKPGQGDRFRNVRRELAARLGAVDGGAALTQRIVVPNYRRITAAQAGDAIRALIAAGATDVRVACVARAIAAPTDRRLGTAV